MKERYNRFYQWLVADFHFCNIFNLSNIFKLLLIYSSGIFWVLVLDFDFSEGLWRKLIAGKLSNERISFYSVRDRVGEGMLYKRLQIASNRLGVDYVGSNLPEQLIHFWFTKHFYQVTAGLLNHLFNLRFNLALTHHVNIIPAGYNIAYLNMPTSSLYEISGKFNPAWKHLKKYDVYADLYSFVHGSNKYLAEAIKAHNLSNRKIIPFYIAHHYVDYTTAIPKEAVITGSLWGCNRNSLRFQKALQRLAADKLLVAYGIKDTFQFLGNSYLGAFEDFGNVVSCMFNLQKQHGIALIIHNLEHMIEGIPTSRILEAVASGALVITDKNYFIEKFFGNNVLYFDSLVDEEQIYQQIKSHIQWAKDNPIVAEVKARAAYKIFVDNFTIEKQLQSLLEQLQKGGTFSTPD